MGGFIETSLKIYWEESDKSQSEQSKMRNDSVFFRNDTPPGWKDWLFSWKYFEYYK